MRMHVILCKNLFKKNRENWSFHQTPSDIFEKFQSCIYRNIMVFFCQFGIYVGKLMLTLGNENINFLLDFH